MSGADDRMARDQIGRRQGCRPIAFLGGPGLVRLDVGDRAQALHVRGGQQGQPEQCHHDQAHEDPPGPALSGLPRDFHRYVRKITPRVTNPPREYVAKTPATSSVIAAHQHHPDDGAASR